MKICPKCGIQYADPTLNFCLDDGSVLVVQQIADEQTVLLNQTRDTEPRQPHPVTIPTGQPAWNVQTNGIGAQKKSSKLWIVVLLLFGGVILLCGGGIAGLFFIGNQEKNKKNQQVDDRKPTPQTNQTNASSSQRVNETVIDLANWGKKTQQFGKTEFIEGELQMSARSKGYFYVLIATQGDGITNKADTSVKVRNIDGKETDVGYGLVIHSSPTPLDKDYAFLIDTVGQRYRVVYHLSKKENVLVDWTKSNAVRTGTAENILEARDLDTKIELYINGTMVTSIRNVHGHPNGVPGVYSGDGIKAGFRDLTVRR